MSETPQGRGEHDWGEPRSKTITAARRPLHLL